MYSIAVWLVPMPGNEHHGDERGFVRSSHWLPQHRESMGVPVTDNLEEALDGADVIMPLRLQLERQASGAFPTIREYRDRYGLDLENYLLFQRCSYYAPRTN